MRDALRRQRPSQHYFAFLSYSHTRRRRSPNGCTRRSSNSAFRHALVGRLTDHGPIPRAAVARSSATGSELAASDDLGEEIERGAGRVALPDRAVLARQRRVALDQCRDRGVQAAPPRRLRPGRDRRRRTVRQRDARARGGGMLPAGAAPEIRPARAADRQARRADRRRPARGRRRPAAWGCSRSSPACSASGSTTSSSARRQRRQRRLTLYRRGLARRDGRDQRPGRLRLRSRRATKPATSGARPKGWSASCSAILRDKLEPIGRLDALDAVGARALAYYREAGQVRAVRRSAGPAVEGADADGRDRQLARRPRRRAAPLPRSDGRHGGSGAARCPDDPQRLFDHAQNVFWVGRDRPAARPNGRGRGGDARI